MEMAWTDESHLFWHVLPLVPFLMASNTANMEHSLHCLSLPCFLGERRTAGAEQERSLSAFHATFHDCFVKLALLQEIKKSIQLTM